MIQKQYIYPSRPLVVSKEWVEELDEKIEDFKNNYNKILKEIERFNIKDVTNDSPYILFLTNLQQQRKIISFAALKEGHGKNVFKIDDRYKIKILRSKSYEGTSKFYENYRFSLSKKATVQALNNKVNAFVFLLEKSGDYVWIPRTFLEETLLKAKHLDGLNRAWQIQVSRKDKNNIYIRSRGRNKKEVYSTSNFINKIRYKKSANELKKVKFDKS